MMRWSLLEQGGFRKDRSTVQQILTLRLIAKKYLERGKCVYNCFLYYTKVFDSVWCDALWTVLHSFRVPGKLIVFLHNLYTKSQLAVKIGIKVGEWFTAELSNRQGDPISPLSFLSLLERVMETTECSTLPNGVYVHRVHINDIRYADDLDLLVERERGLQSLVANYKSVVKLTDYRSAQTTARYGFQKTDKPSYTTCS